jgi:cell division protein FtsI (penicillin-binding protein 3)
MPFRLQTDLVPSLRNEVVPSAKTKGFATSGWNAAPVTVRVIARVAPLLGLDARPTCRPADRLILAATQEGR